MPSILLINPDSSFYVAMKQDSSNTIEPQYQELLDRQKQKGLVRLGLMSSQVYLDDPKRLAFVLSRYKFVSKMLEGKSRVLEIGCADAFGSPIVAKTVKHLTAIDIDPLFIADARKRTDTDLDIEFHTHDLLNGPFGELPFDAVFACDVFEHILPRKAEAFLTNICLSLSGKGVLILGVPSLESQVHASPQSKIGHVNCMSGKDFQNFVSFFFENTFLFGMNDEVVHTGYSAMCHYHFVLATHPLKTVD